MNQATLYDIVNRAIFLPWGGTQRLRQRLVDALEVRPGHRVLELGCGTGQVTVRLLAADADVVAVDALPGMLDRARTRAPGATFLEGDVITSPVGGGFDRVVLSFLLHNFDGPGRVRVLRRAERALALGGRIGVLEWALPPGRVRARLWRRFVGTLEPSATAREVLDGALDADIAAADLAIADRRSAVGGRAQVLVLRRQADVEQPEEQSLGRPEPASTTHDRAHARTRRPRGSTKPTPVLGGRVS
jgi:SAM-dependent methyltransferase